MIEWLKKFDNLFFTLGRLLLGLYFIGPGIGKILDFMSTLTLMRMKGIPFSLLLLPITIIIQIIGGTFLILGKNLRIVCLILCMLTILINISFHNFWDLVDEPTQAHESQNFFKNLAIAAGLLILSTKDKN